MSSPFAHSLTVRRKLNAPCERVFEAWANPELLRVWLGGQDTQVLHAEVDFSVGGMYQLDVKVPTGGVARLSGMYQEIEAPNRIVFTWAWGENYDASSATLVTVEMTEHDKQTEIFLKHERFDDPPSRDLHEEGWIMRLGVLDKLLV